MVSIYIFEKFLTLKRSFDEISCLLTKAEKSLKFFNEITEQAEFNIKANVDDETYNKGISGLLTRYMPESDSKNAINLINRVSHVSEELSIKEARQYQKDYLRVVKILDFFWKKKDMFM